MTEGATVLLLQVSVYQNDVEKLWQKKLHNITLNPFTDYLLKWSGGLSHMTLLSSKAGFSPF